MSQAILDDLLCHYLSKAMLESTKNIVQGRVPTQVPVHAFDRFRNGWHLCIDPPDHGSIGGATEFAPVPHRRSGRRASQERPS
jgi:hypothetical protein